jgi:protein-S-isoprenylcysteine O-methyltransferase Ste14
VFRHRPDVGTLAFAVVVPGTVVGLIPWRLAGGEHRRVPGPGAKAAGAVLFAAGLPLVAASFVRFVRAGGTPAPTAETQRLVVDGPYRVTRNPQYVGVVAMLVGEGLLLGSGRVLRYAAVCALAFDTWVRIYEEPRLRVRFGDEAGRFLAATPRWFARPARR